MKHTIIATVFILILFFVPEKDLVRAIACGGVYFLSLIAQEIYDSVKSKQEENRKLINSLEAIALDLLTAIRDKKQ